MGLLKHFEENATLRRLFRKIFLHTTYYLEQELRSCKTVLDLGCGYDSPIKDIHKSYSVGVDLSKVYLLESKRKGIHDEYALMDVRRLGFRPKSFDCVVALDILEHLEKVDGFQVLGSMEKIAKKKIIVQTPNGFVPQQDVCSLQVHRSGWIVDDFRRRGYAVRGMAGLRSFRGERAVLKYKPKIIWAIISGLTSKITYHFPEFAYQLFCVKVLNKDNC
jgi:SAM-dependent methyltransferase